jgi:cellulose synthase/poly-beta-1,6-N-acetylglucosamine synthase-like glycosyltransferase
MSLFAITLLLLVIYHHLGYPLLLKLFSKIKAKKRNDKELSRSSVYQVRGYKHRGFYPSIKDGYVPSIHIVVPAFNEEKVIQQKIDSMAWLDYPDNKLSITIYCDGCSDNTVKCAIKSQRQFSNRELNIRIVNLQRNSGKVAVINRAISESDEELIVFSDASAILSTDALWRTAQHFIEDTQLAVVTGDYQLLMQGSEGEAAYWQYQNKVRSLESNLGSVMGVTGGYYAILRDVCFELEADTINDDFILPMRAVIQGYRATYDKNIIVVETEPTPLKEDGLRRQRISQGNMQQLLRLKGLLLPGPNFNRGWVCWMFISGKCFRVLMPYILIILFALSFMLAIESYFFMFIFFGQVSAYLLALINHCQLKNRLVDNKLVRLVGYLCQGHLMGLIGSAEYLKKIFMKRFFFSHLNSEQHWKKITSEPEPNNHPKDK